MWALALANFIDKRDEDEVDIVTAFSNDRFLSTDSNIEAVALYGNLYYSSEAKRDMLENIAGKLGIGEGYVFSSEEKNGVTTECLTKNSKHAITEIKFVTMKTSRDASVERQYIMVDINIFNSLDSAIVYRERVENIFKEMELEAEVTLTLKGNISGSLSVVEKNNIADDIIESIDAEIVTQRRDSEIFTVYAYSDGIDDYVVNGTSKTNVNVAITYDEVLNETNIYMATPIIGEDY